LVLVGAVSPAAAQLTADCATGGGASCDALIPDANKGVAGVLESTIALDGAACNGPDRVLDVNVSVALIHDWVGDLRLTLVHPDGTTSAELLTPSVGNLDDDVEATFNDELPIVAKDLPAIGGVLAPATPLAVFDGLAVTGSWTLRLEDLNNSGFGALRGWSLEVVCGLPTLTVTATDPGAAEPGSDTGELTVSRGEVTSGELAVLYTVAGSAVPGADYVALQGTVTIPDGASTAVVLVQPLDDVEVESPETVVLSLSASAGYLVGSPSEATVVIADDGDLTAAPDAIPTLSRLGTLVMISVLALAGWMALRRP
jgi:subtilisin-like proprotein convertase family protein